jgi:uncharacterized membrane protein YdfJ with MMPL/SSD domain
MLPPPPFPLASFVDTFFVRTIFVPAVFFIGVESNWWPGHVPEGVKENLYDDSDDNEEVTGKI